MDFGLAKKLDAHGQEQSLSTLTREGLAAGTLAYMSPEQVRGDAVDARSDLFSFGVVLYEMPAGLNPFRRSTSVETGNAILNETQEPIRKLMGDIDPLLEHCIGKLLAKDPARRYQIIHEVRTDLAEVMRSLDLPDPGRSRYQVNRIRKWLQPVLYSVLAPALLLSAGLYFLRPETMNLEDHRYSPFAVDAENEALGAWSPDGSSAAYQKELPGDIRWEMNLMVRALDSPAATRLVRGVMPHQPPFWSPGGERIFYLKAGKGGLADLWSVSAARGEPELVLSALGEWPAAALSPDGQALALWKSARQDKDKGSSYSVWVSSPPGAELRRYLPSSIEVRWQSLNNRLCYSPDGSKIGLLIGDAESQAMEFWVLPWPDGSRKGLRKPFQEQFFGSPYRSLISGFDWMPDSRHVVFSCNDSLWLGDTRNGDLKRLTATSAGEFFPSVSSDGGRILFTQRTRDYDIVEAPLDGSPIRTLLATGRQEHSPSWSQSGDRLAFVTDRLGEPEVWLRSAKGDWEMRAVTQKDFPGDRTLRIMSVVISPDGTRLAYSRQGEQSGVLLWISPIEGGRPVPAFPGAEKAYSAPAWSPDGAFITCSAVVGGPGRLVIARPGTREPFRVLHDSFYPQTVSAWSPDGRWIACGGQGSSKILVVSPDGREFRIFPSPVPVFVFESMLVWSRDSSVLHVISSRKGNARLDALEVTTGQWRQIADWGPRIPFGVEVGNQLLGSLSPGGKSVATTTSVGNDDLWILDGLAQPKRWPWPLAR